MVSNKILKILKKAERERRISEEWDEDIFKDYKKNRDDVSCVNPDLFGTWRGDGNSEERVKDKELLLKIEEKFDEIRNYIKNSEYVDGRKNGLYMRLNTIQFKGRIGLLCCEQYRHILETSPCNLIREWGDSPFTREPDRSQG